MTYKGIAAEPFTEYDDAYLNPDSDEAEVCLMDRDGNPVCRAKVVHWGLAALGAFPELVGLKGSPTRVKNVASVVLAATETRLVEPTDEGIAGLVHELIEEHILG
jgi:electron transfer flavoprotein beta subunit